MVISLFVCGVATLKTIDLRFPLFRLKPLDIELMKNLHDKVNIIPLIAKADTMTPEECARFKKQVDKLGNFANSFFSNSLLVEWFRHLTPKLTKGLKLNSRLVIPDLVLPRLSTALTSLFIRLRRLDITIEIGSQTRYTFPLVSTPPIVIKVF